MRNGEITPDYRRGNIRVSQYGVNNQLPYLADTKSAKRKAQNAERRAKNQICPALRPALLPQPRTKKRNEHFIFVHPFTPLLLYPSTPLPPASSYPSTSPISRTRVAYRPPSNGVLNHVATISFAKVLPTTPTPTQKTLASTCARANFADVTS